MNSRHMHIFFFSFMLILGALAAWNGWEGQATAAPAATVIPDGALVVDVRTPGEFSNGHYRGAINVPLSRLYRGYDQLAKKDATIVVYCRSGSRSAVAKRILSRQGFQKVIDGGGLSQMGL